MKTIYDFDINEELVAYLTDPIEKVPLFTWIGDQLHGDWIIDSVSFVEDMAKLKLGPPEDDLPWRKDIRGDNLLDAIKRAIEFTRVVDVNEYTNEFFKRQ